VTGQSSEVEQVSMQENMSSSKTHESTFHLIRFLRIESLVAFGVLFFLATGSASAQISSEPLSKAHQ
jgi:hypothetical protein